MQHLIRTNKLIHNSPNEARKMLWVILIRALRHPTSVSLKTKRNNCKLTITIAIPNEVNNTSPHLPVLNTHPFPRAITHMLSNPFGSTYIANSPLLLFSSTNNDKPAANPGSQNDALEMRTSMSHCGRRASGAVRMLEGRAPVRRRVRSLWSLCL